MTAVRDGYRIYTFDEWKVLPVVQEMYAKLEDCDVCYGDGRHTCDCGHDHDCGNCGGTGKTDNLRDIYESHLRTELQHAIAWRDGIPLSSDLQPMTISVIDGLPDFNPYRSDAPIVRLYIH